MCGSAVTACPNLLALELAGLPGGEAVTAGSQEGVDQEIPLGPSARNSRRRGVGDMIFATQSDIVPAN